MSDLLEIAQQLINCPSITPHDSDCQSIIAKYLNTLGFTIEQLPFGEVSNLWARHGNQGPLFIFVGHTDVVPTGPLEQWDSPPFQAEVRDGYLYGRGSADMKGSLAAMLIACKNFIKKHPHHPGSIAWLITSDEEGPSVDGTAKVIEVLQQRHEKIDFCLVGEPTCEKQLGDTIKIGRRGSLSGELIIYGKQGHIAYPQNADNPIHKALNALKELTDNHWDQGQDYFQPTSLQLSNIHAGTGAGNVIPGELRLQFNFRYSPAVTAEALQTSVKNILEHHQLSYQLTWHHSGLPFLTTQDKLIAAAKNAVEVVTGVKPTLSTSGGTSDGRFVAPTGAQVIEFGPCNQTIHQINECVAIDDLTTLALVYEKVLENLLLP